MFGTFLGVIFGGFVLGFIGAYIAHLCWSKARECISRRAKLIIAIICGLIISVSWGLDFYLSEDLVLFSLAAIVFYPFSVGFVAGWNGTW